MRAPAIHRLQSALGGNLLEGLALSLLGCLIASVPNAKADLAKLRLPDGFEIRILSSEVKNARQMALAADGTLYVGSLQEGKLYALPKALEGGQPQVVTLAEGLPLPSGVTERNGDLYVAALNQVLRFPDIGQKLAPGAAYELITDQLPDERHHGWKYIKFGPDGLLYVPVGAPCNICLSEDPRFASILGMDPSSGATRIVARGVRNSVGFAWHPQPGQLWFTDNGRDLLGDDLPPEEVNVVKEAGQHFGYPFVHGSNILDPEFGTDADLADFVPPVVELQAHAAALGVAFYTGDQFPEPYRNALFIAEHGSWNRSSKVGYRVGVIVFDNGTPRYEPFITGWLQDQTNWGRPNDVLVAPDGSLLISEDRPGTIYQVRFSGS